ncbi:MAG: hypothetical protein ACM3JI_01930, partial [Anaerolineae bacterium]
MNKVEIKNLFIYHSADNKPYEKLSLCKTSEESEKGCKGQLKKEVQTVMEMILSNKYFKRIIKEDLELKSGERVELGF